MITFPEGITVEAVIFDFDGVIVDTEPLHYAAFQKVLEPTGLHFSWQEYVETYIGFDDRDAFRHAYATRGETLDSAGLSGLIARKAAYFDEIIASGVAAYPGVVELITGLKTAGIPLAICSGALRSDIDPILVQLGLTTCFDVIVTADDVAASKPDPECYRLAFAKLHSACGAAFTRKTTIAIEDTPAGIASAKGAGLPVCAVTNSYPANRLGDATFITESLAAFVD